MSTHMISSRSHFLGAVSCAIALLPLVAGAQTGGGRIDRPLRESIEQGCAGTQSAIITVAPGHREALRHVLAVHGDVVHGEFPAIDAIAATVHCDDLRALGGFGSIRAVSANAVVAASTKGFARDVEGRAARDLKKIDFAALGVRPAAAAGGFGIGVAVIDSGIEPGPDFGNRITAFYDFTNGNIRAAAPGDEYGHGTHIAGLIGSEFVGIAPYSRLIGLKVLDNRGRGTTENVVRAIEFAIANRELLGIDVLNLSIGHPIYEPAATDPLVQAVEHAVREGLTVVVAAGNFGVNPETGEPGYAGIVSPANAPSAITVGAANNFGTVSRADDRVARYSSRGPSWYDAFAKPDVVAPGHDLLSVAARGSSLRRLQERRGNRGNYIRLSGTSMAAGVTSAVVALLLQANSDLTPNTIKAVLEYTAIPIRGDRGDELSALDQGTGQVQVIGALTLARLIEPRAQLGTTWLTGGFLPSSRVGATRYAWSQAIIWGDRWVAGEALLRERRPAWANNIVWGNALDEDDNIVWGNAFDEDDNIVWGNNVVWGNLLDEDDNIVWGNNVVWGNRAIERTSR